MLKSHKLHLILVAVLAVFVLAFVFPQGINKGIDSIKQRTERIPLLRSIPRLPERPFKLGLDLQGGSRLLYLANLSSIEEGDEGEAMAGLRDVIERRVNLFGVGEPVVSVQDAVREKRLLVELPGVEKIEEAINMIGQTPFLEFKEELPQEQREKVIKENLGADAEQIEPAEACLSGQFLAAFLASYHQDPCYQPTALTGQYLEKSTLAFDDKTGTPMVLLEFDKEGSEIFRNLTEGNIGKVVAIYIDNTPISLPVIREEIPSGRAQITGSFTLEEARELVRNLNAGALPVPIELISQNTVGPTLGRVSLEKSLVAGVFGLLAVLLFMIVFYRLSGLLAGLSLLIYAAVLLGLFKLIPVTLTLAGIGGAILSVGMAVDANVLIFERMKEERKAGESFQRTVEQGFKRAWTSIRDSNMTTLLVAVIMFGFGTSFVRGFALTLSLGILVSMFSALFITRTLLRSFIGTRWEKIKWLWQ